MNIRRAVIASAAQIAATILVTVIIVTVYFTFEATQARGSLPQGDLEPIGMRVGQWTAIVVGIVAAFFAGRWGARGLGDEALKQGLVIGALIGLGGLLFDAVAGNDIGLMTAASVLLNLAAAVAGAAVARSQTRPITP